jgi:hypothetical protein
VRYLCLVYRNEARFEHLSSAEFSTIVRESIAYHDEMRRAGHLIASDALESEVLTLTLCVRNGMLAVTDGPFAETKEQMDGFFLIEARDLNEAIRLASKTPSARLGTIEIRSIRELQVE